ncbi:ABC transporter substrate-binding protein [Actinacidiphila alni]|uniref:ABC transporter substrate-binding protein n=1 Tax=Actinacidiphila alni TaxID=380248 RepID=UPI0015A69B0B|nr:ABC transporter substrate-binding protein [Actinacidiphila alni]
MGLTYAPKTLNPDYAYDPANYFIMDNIYSRLVNYGYDDEVHGDLARNWQKSADGLTYTFHLRSGVKWSDGKPLTSADVMWTAKSIIKEKGYGAAALAGVSAVTAPDAQTVVMKLAQPNSSFLDQLAQRYGWVVLPQHVFDGTDVTSNPANKKPVGSGPFVVTSFTPGSHVELKANPGYFGGAPKTKALSFRFFSSPDAAVTALQSHEIQFIANAPNYASVPTLKKAAGITVETAAATPPTDVWLGFNLARKPLNDLKVRTAIAQALDPGEINDLVYGGTKKVSGTVYDPSSRDYDASARQPAHDVAAANALLDQAGYPKKSGTRFSLTYTGFTASLAGAQQIGEVLKQQLAKVGIGLKVENYDFSIFADKIMQQHDFDITWSGGPHGPDPQTFANYVKTGGNRNAMRYSDPEVDRLFDEAAKSSDASVRSQDYRKIQQIVAKDLPRYTLFQWNYQFAYDSRYSGFWWQNTTGDLPADDYAQVTASG